MLHTASAPAGQARLLNVTQKFVVPFPRLNTTFAAAPNFSAAKLFLSKSKYTSRAGRCQQEGRVKLTLWSAEVERPRGATRMLRETLVHAPLDEVFGFFADAANLAQLTPPWLRFSVWTPLPVNMRAGLEIDYRMSLYGVPFVWCSRIDVWEPGVRFVDRQIIGPYLWWRHEHRFERAGHDTRVIDHVEFLPRAAWMSARFVRHDVERIFNYRQAALAHIFPGHGRESDQPQQEHWADSCSSTQSQ